MTQIKFDVDEKLAKEFKQAVIAKHGTLDLKPEGEEALRLYVAHHKKFILKQPAEDPLKRLIGLCKSEGRHNALEDLKKLDRGELFKTKVYGKKK